MCGRVIGTDELLPQDAERSVSDLCREFLPKGKTAPEYLVREMERIDEVCKCIVNLNRRFFLLSVERMIAVDLDLIARSEYSAYLVYLDNQVAPIAIPVGFDQVSFQYLRLASDDSDYVDTYFNRLTRIWLFFTSLGLLDHADWIWRFAFDLVEDCENQYGRIHKGTPFYFHAVNCILGGNLEKGFLMMHKAVQEDRFTFGYPYFTDTPAYAFVTLDYKKLDQFFQSWVQGLARFVESRIAEYRRTYSGETFSQLDINQLKMKLLQRSVDFMDVVFYFFFSLSRLWYQWDETPRNSSSMGRVLNSKYGSLLETNLILDLCKLVDSTIAEIYMCPSTMWKFVNRLECLSGVLRDRVTLRFGDRLGAVNKGFKSEFSTTLRNLLSGSLVLKDGTTVTLSRIEADLLLSYGLRNVAAHEIQGQKAIFDNYYRICQSLLNCLFFAVSMA